jgi:hypothetical protein
MITKELQQFIEILGLKEGDDKILYAISLIGAGFVEDEFILEKENIYDEYYQFYTKGVSFLFDHKYIKAVFFFLKKNNDFMPCEIELIKGINNKSTKNSVTSILGQPSLVSDKKLNISWIKYVYDKYSLHFEFNLDTKLLQLITLQNKQNKELKIYQKEWCKK